MQTKKVIITIVLAVFAFTGAGHGFIYVEVIKVKADALRPIAEANSHKVDMLNDDHLFQILLLTQHLIGDKAKVEKVVEEYAKNKRLKISMCSKCGRVNAVEKWEQSSGITHGFCAKHLLLAASKLHNLNKPSDLDYLESVKIRQVNEADYDAMVKEYLRTHPDVSGASNATAKSFSSGSKDKFILRVKNAVDELSAEDPTIPITNLNIACKLGYPNTTPLIRRADRNKINLSFAISS